MKQQRTKMVCITCTALKSYSNCIALIGAQYPDLTSFQDKFFLIDGNNLDYFHPSCSSCNKLLKRGKMVMTCLTFLMPGNT